MRGAVAARVGVYALLAAGWVVAAWVLAGSVVPDDLSFPRVDVKATFGGELYVAWGTAP